MSYAHESDPFIHIYCLLSLYISSRLCFLPGKTDPYVTLSLGDQSIRSKKNSQTTVIGPPGEPIWNQVKLLCNFILIQKGKKNLSNFTSSIVFHGFARISLCQLNLF